MSSQQQSNGRIDVHHHYVTKQFLDVFRKHGVDPYGWGMPPWSVQQDIDFGKKINLSAAILSLCCGVEFIKDGALQAKIAHDLNIEAARIRDSNPSRFGFFATIPTLLFEDLAIAEIDYALNVLKADGVLLLSRYGEGNHYLGHIDFKPVWDHLNEKKAVVFVHPWQNQHPEPVNPTLPEPMFDFCHETTRTAMDMITSGLMPDVKDCKIILSHAGGTLPYLAERAASMLPYTPFGRAMTSEGIMEAARSFYFDTALSGSAPQMAAMKEFAKPGHLLFGSDFPFAPPPTIINAANGIDRYFENDAWLDEVNYKSALELFPRFAEQQDKKVELDFEPLQARI